jgi:glucose/mannose transport system permease protein
MHLINWQSLSGAWAEVGGNIGNSLFLAVVATVLAALPGPLNGDALARWKFRGANTRFALMLFGMFIPYQAALIPLVEAATIDGAVFWSISRRVILPLSAPAFVVVMIWEFAQVWNEFLFAGSIKGECVKA